MLPAVAFCALAGLFLPSGQVPHLLLGYIVHDLEVGVERLHHGVDALLLARDGREERLLGLARHGVTLPAHDGDALARAD